MILLDISQAGTGIGIKQAFLNLQNQSFVTKAFLYHHIQCLKTLALFFSTNDLNFKVLNLYLTI